MFQDQYQVQTKVKNDNGGFLLIVVLVGFFVIAACACLIENYYESKTLNVCPLPYSNGHV